MYVWSILRGCLFSGSLLLALGSDAVAMPKANADQIAAFCSSQRGVKVSTTNYWDGTGAWVWNNGGLGHKACDGAEPNTQTEWCEMQWVGCTDSPSTNGCVALGQYVGFPSNISGSYYLKYTGSNCAQVQAASTGCSSPDNAGICDYVDSVNQMAMRAEASARDVSNELSNININLGAYNGYTNTFQTAGEMALDTQQWTKWGVEEDLKFRNNNAIPFMQQSLAAANRTNSILGDIAARSGSNLGDPFLASTMGDIATNTDSTTTAVQIVNSSVKAGTAQEKLTTTAVNNNTKAVDGVGAKLDALGVDQRQTTAAIQNAAEYMASAYANASPTINLPPTDLSPVVSAVNASKVSASADASTTNSLIAGLTDKLSNTGSVPSTPALPDLASAAGVGSGASSSVLGGVGDLVNTVVNVGSLDSSGFLSGAGSLPVISFNLRLGGFPSIPIVWDFSTLLLPMQILRLFMWLSTWFMVINILLGRRK